MPALEAIKAAMQETFKDIKSTQTDLEKVLDEVAMAELEFGLEEAKAIIRNKDVTPIPVMQARVRVELAELKQKLLLSVARKQGLTSRLKVLDKELDGLRSFFSLAKEEARMASYS